MSLNLAYELIGAGIPVIVCPPRPGWKPGDKQLDVMPPGGWSVIEAADCDLSSFRPGVDTLAMVGGHGVDVVDCDPKNGGSLTNLPPFRRFGRTGTPSGGAHDYVRSTGVGKISPFETSAGHVGDYVGGTRQGGGRLLAFLPGSARPKYPGLTYTVLEPLRLEELLENDPDDDLMNVLTACGGSRNGLPGKPSAGLSQVRTFLAEHSTDLERPCHFGRAAVAGMLTAAQATVPGDPKAGRHGWAVRSATRCVELVRAGCAWSGDLDTLEAELDRIKPEGGSDWTGILAWAVNNADGPVKCGQHNPTTVAHPAPDPFESGVINPTPGTAEAADNAQEAADETPADRAKRLFPRLDWHALWADDDEEEWIHDPLLPARRSVVIYSPPKVGKSLLMLEMAVAISRGETFLGYTGRQVRVLYVDFENDPRGDVRSRLQAMGYGPADLEGLDYLSYPSMAGLDTERGALELLEAVTAYRSEVVVIDTVSRAVDGKENENDTYLAMYRHTGLALKRAGVAIIRLDHTGKDETKGQRGASAKSGDVDAVWKLTRVTDDRFRLECTDSRMSIGTKTLLITRHTLPRLHHSVNAISAVTDRQAKIAHIIGLCNVNGIPADATRKTVTEFIKSRGMTARAELLGEVVRLRKAVPNAGNKASGNSAQNTVSNAGNNGNSDPLSEHESLFPSSREQSGTEDIGITVPTGSSSKTARGGTAELETEPDPNCSPCAMPGCSNPVTGGGICSPCNELTKATS